MFAGLENIVLTPHIAGLTVEANGRVGTITAHNSPPSGAIFMTIISPETLHAGIVEASSAHLKTPNRLLRP